MDHNSPQPLLSTEEYVVKPESAWRKSSHSEQDACVEVVIDQRSMVRDSKDPALGLLTFSDSAWIQFIESVRKRPASRS
ncbi:DUF397 domain-containing protein [Streptomyces sp. IB201691-2A2]|nr:DUF397 domain-containing protein [Streptomyces sp. IB201691-2A2]